jgi:hypothetical protein
MDMPEIARKQQLRNTLSAIEDEAREMRKSTVTGGQSHKMLSLLARLTQIVREELVR